LGEMTDSFDDKSNGTRLLLSRRSSPIAVREWPSDDSCGTMMTFGLPDNARPDDVEQRLHGEKK